MKTKIFFLTFFLLSTFNFQLSTLYAWVEPSDTSNIVAPLNTGSTFQYKQGGIGTAGSLGVGTASPQAQLQVVGKSSFSRDAIIECCGNDTTITLGENTVGTGKKASISFHNGGVAEGTLELANNTPRRLRIYDNQGQGMGLEMTGNLYTPVIYDSNNTGYYLNPDYWSNLNSVNMTGNLCFNGDCRTAWPNNSLWSQNGSSIYYNGGSVGIGTASPGYKMTVQGSYSSPEALIGYDGANGLFFQAQGTSSHYNWLIGQQRIVDTGLEFTPSTTAGGTTFSNPAMILKRNGSVGIGTVSPRNDIGWTGALDVNGQIRGTRYYDDDVNYYADLNAGANLGGNWVFNGNVVGNGGITMGSGQTFYSPGRMHIFGEENLYLLNRGGVYVSGAWGGNGNLAADGSVSAGNAVCIRGDCRSGWPRLVAPYVFAGGGSTQCNSCPPGYTIIGVFINNVGEDGNHGSCWATSATDFCGGTNAWWSAIGCNALCGQNF